MRRRSGSSARYAQTVATMDKARLSQNSSPCLSSKGKTRNRTNDGKTSQNICEESCAICDEDEPSARSQTNARRDVRGSDAIRAAKPGDRFATSEMVAMSIAETRILSE